MVRHADSRVRMGVQAFSTEKHAKTGGGPMPAAGFVSLYVRLPCYLL